MDKAAAGRTCGTCTMCCKLLGITELNKPVGKWCPHCDVGRGCKIYEERPSECQTFLCLWLADDRFGLEWKPNASKMVLTSGDQGNSIEIRCDPGQPTVWRAEPYYSTIKSMSLSAEPFDGSVYVIVGKKSTLVTPAREFELGEVAPEDRIAKEVLNGRVINVSVIKAGQH